MDWLIATYLLPEVLRTRGFSHEAMLELTILKVCHSGFAEARKLLVYIQACDVFGEENAAEQETIAEFGELEWERVLSSVKSLTAFRALQDKAIYFEQNPGRQAYGKKVREYLFRNKVFLWHAERFSQEESQGLFARLKESDALFERALQDLNSGRIEGFLSQYWNYELKFNKLVDERDQHIARQLSLAEERIRKRYVCLERKEIIQYSIALGGTHAPEQYCGLPCKVVDLRENGLVPRIVKGVRQRDYTAEVKRDVLAQNAPFVFPELDSEKLQAMGLETVMEAIRAIAEKK